MKQNLLFTLVTFGTLLTGFKANAQFGDLVQKAKDKAAQKASDMMDKKSGATDQSTDNVKKSSKLTINSSFDFIAGDSILFADDFAKEADGSTTHAFKTNGSAGVVSLKEEGDKWLALQDNSTYKLTKQLFYPKHFTVEFDIIAVADQIRDIYPLIIGFAKDNSVRDFDSGSGAYVNIMYYNSNEIQINSSYNSKYLDTKFDLDQFANRKMHVSINVDGDKMVVYLEKTKLADTQLFLPESPKNFYLSAPMQYHNGSKILVSNFKVATFKK